MKSGSGGRSRSLSATTLEYLRSDALDATGLRPGRLYGVGILIVAQDYDNVGGTEAYFRLWLRLLLHRNKIHIHLVSYAHPNGPDDDIVTVGESRVIVHHIPRSLAAVDEIIETLVASRAVDVLVAHSLWVAEVAHAVEYARSRGLPTLVVHHFSQAPIGASRKAAVHADIVCTVSRLATAILEAEGAYRRVRYVGPLVDLDYYRRDAVDDPGRIRRAEGLCNFQQRFVLLAPHRLIAAKGHLDALRALAILKKRGRSLALVITGGSEKSRLAEFAAYCGCAGLSYVIAREDRRTHTLVTVDRAHGNSEGVDVLFVDGGVDRQMLRRMYSGVDVMILPTYHAEGLSLSLLEAQAMGVPVIATDTASNAEAMSVGRSGWLVRFNSELNAPDSANPSVLAAAVERVMTMSATEIAVISRYAAAWVRRQFNPHQMIAAHEDALALLVQTGRSVNRCGLPVVD